MKTIITIQHTQSLHHTNGMAGSLTYWGSTELGVEQARNIGKNLRPALSGRQFAMYSSDLKRAKQTAMAVSEYLGAVPVFRSELRERDPGKCCRKSVQWLKENQKCMKEQ